MINNNKIIINTNKMYDDNVKIIESEIYLHLYTEDEYTMSNDMDTIDCFCDTIIELKNIIEINYSCINNNDNTSYIIIKYSSIFGTDFIGFIVKCVLTQIFSNYKIINLKTFTY